MQTERTSACPMDCPDIRGGACRNNCRVDVAALVC
jgi:hypothetical protein